MTQQADVDLAVAREVLTIEAHALTQMAEELGDEFTAAVDAMETAKGRIICAGIGKSGHIARKIAATLASTGTAAYYVHPTEASHGDLGMIQGDDVVLALSRSGETAELDDLIQYTRRFGVVLIALTAQRESSLGRASDIVLAIPDAPEACAETKAPTTSTTLSLALGDAVAVALLRRRGFDAQSFKVYHPGGKLGAMLKTATDLMAGGSAMPLISSGAPLAEGIAELSRKGLGCLGVTDPEGRLIGMITDGDLRRVLADNRKVATVDDVMTASPLVVEPKTLAAAVLQRMNEKTITQIFVVEDQKPVGIVHMHDILRAGLV